MSKASPVYSEGPARYDIPVGIAREVGRIIVRWAYFEHLIQVTIWTLADVDERVGRLALREPRVTDRLDLLRDLAALRGLVINADAFAKLRHSANATGEKRDLLAHGVWRSDPEGWGIQLTRGSYPGGQAIDHDTKRRIAPERVAVDLPGLLSISENIERLIGGINKIREELPPELPPLRDKRPPRSAPKRRARGPIPGTRGRPH